MKTLLQVLEFICGITYEDMDTEKQDLLDCGYRPTGERALGKYDIYSRGECTVWYDPERDEIVNWQRSVS